MTDFPADDMPELTIAGAATVERGAGVAAPALRILLVEDNPGDARLIREFLRHDANRFTLTVVPRLSEAREALRWQPFDAILLDLSLPDSSGLATFQTLHSETRRIPIVILTGNNDSAVALEAMQLGAQDYLVKSDIDGALLQRAIRYTVERHRLHERLEQAERVKALGHLAGKIAHEFNNVLMGIQPFAELIARYGSGDERIVRAAATISDSVRRGRTISTEILRYMNPAGMLTHPVDVGEWLEQIREELQRMTKPSRITIGAARGLRVHADRDQLTQVLVNLVCNARDAAGPGAEITIFATPHESEGLRYAKIEVQDNGGGMTPEVLQHAFEPLFTTKHTGTGLGLPVSMQIIQAHGGEMTVESIPGVGSIFRIKLPLAME